MREIKLRAWDDEHRAWSPYICVYDDGSFMTGEETAEGITVWNGDDDKAVVLEQYTGLKDRKGREIYEGDILNFAGQMTADDSFGADPNGFVYDETNKHAVVWDEKIAAWSIETTNHPDNESWKYRRDTRGPMAEGACEIIGNVHENPELLGKAHD